MDLVKPELPDWSLSLNYSLREQQLHLLPRQSPQLQVEHLLIVLDIELLGENTCCVGYACNLGSPLDYRVI